MEKKDLRCHQKIIKERTLKEDLALLGSDVFLAPLEDYILAKEEFSEEIVQFIKRYEWLGGVGINPRWVFTARVMGRLAGLVCLNLPNAYSKLLGEGTKDLECLIQRGASASFAHPHLGSKLIRFACRWMVHNTDKRIFYGYADISARESGTIYLSAGFTPLGYTFGGKALYVTPSWNNGRAFSPQSLRRTPVFKKWFRTTYGLPWPKEWCKPNGFKDLARIRKDTCVEGSITNGQDLVWLWYRWGDAIIKSSRKIGIPPKGKFVLILGKNKKEQRELDARKTFKPAKVMKRDDPKMIKLLEKHGRDFQELVGSGSTGGEQ